MPCYVLTDFFIVKSIPTTALAARWTLKFSK